MQEELHGRQTRPSALINLSDCFSKYFKRLLVNQSYIVLESRKGHSVFPFELRTWEIDWHNFAVVRLAIKWVSDKIWLLNHLIFRSASHFWLSSGRMCLIRWDPSTSIYQNSIKNLVWPLNSMTKWLFSSMINLFQLWERSNLPDHPDSVMCMVFDQSVKICFLCKTSKNKAPPFF
jgi:hypothetical protein